MKLWMDKPRVTGLLSIIVVLAMTITNTSIVSASVQQTSQYPQISSDPQKVYLPVIYTAYPSTPQANVPHFSDGILFGEMAVFGMGQVTPLINYADVRMGYNNTELNINVTIFDRRLWNDTSPVYAEFDLYDSVTILLNTGNYYQPALSPDIYKFTLQAYKGGSPIPYRAVYRWGEGGWEQLGIDFNLVAGWRGNDFNDNSDDRGWVANFYIPFSSLGLPRPAEGTTWGVTVFIHDKDEAAMTVNPVGIWPQNSNQEKPFTWTKLRFGLATYTAPPVTSSQTVMIREGINGVVVPDAGVGGTTGNLCPGDAYFIWNVWGNLNFGSRWDFNLQNQQDVADWPCFSKAYLRFPIDMIPPGKKIVSATLLLHFWGGSKPINGPSSLIQVFTVNQTWQEDLVTWNNGPWAWENVSRTWVHTPTVWPNWPKIPIYWDVSYAVDQAYQAGKPVNLLIYEADWAQNSGKYFTSSEAEEWNAVGRPTLFIEWGQ